ncbi:DUF3786 domain-containing protein [Desulfococcaceae bacterium HSG9]|nr:DUF3786 domain-containing protein [Desulfococcaceae bacterium HSG9]
MAQFNNLMEIFKLLDKSNCKKCNLPTCMAFAAAVFKGQKQLSDCPLLDSEIIKSHEGQSTHKNPLEQQADEFGANLKRKISAIDLASAAQRLCAQFEDNKLTIKCLGKKIGVDGQGNITTDIHVHSWLTTPVIDYVVNSSETPVSGQWVPFRELEGGKTWYRLFGQMCEKPLKKVADNYTGLFADMLELFNGKQVENHYDSDISLVLHPLPKVPLLICYWHPEDGLESDLTLFFDSTAEDNLSIESIYTLGVGLTIMFEKITLRHRQ